MASTQEGAAYRVARHAVVATCATSVSRNRASQIGYTPWAGPRQGESLPRPLPARHEHYRGRDGHPRTASTHERITHDAGSPTG